MDSKKMREKRANLAEQARAILDKAAEEKRDLTAEETQQFDKLHGDIDRMKGEIDRIERQEELDRELRESQGALAGVNALDGATDPETGLPADNRASGKLLTPEEIRAQQQASAFRSWLRHGMAGLTMEQRQVMTESRTDLTPEQRAQAAGIDTAGGYTCPPEFVTRVESALKAFAGIRQTRATILRTSTGNDIPMPTSDDTSNKGERIGENKAVSEKDIEFGAKVLRAYIYSSRMVRASLVFLQDTAIANVEGWLTDRLGERIGRKFADDSINATGNNEPEGLASVTVLGKQGGSQTKIKYDELVDLEHSIDPAYRRQSEFLLGDGLLRELKKLKDGEGRPLWVAGVAVREPDRILGYPYAVCMEIPNPAAGGITAYFGDFSKFHIRDVQAMQLLRLSERYAEFLQVAFLLFTRHDCMLLDAGTHPIKHFKQAN